MNKQTIIVIAALSILIGVFIGQSTSEKNLGALPKIDCKGATCGVYVDINKTDEIKKVNFKDRKFYAPDEWNAKTEQEIEADENERFNNWKAHVEAASLIDTPIE